jgi:hypothetical protein
MTTVQDVFKELINKTSNYEVASDAISSAIDVLVAENEEIDTTYVDKVIYEENKKRGVASSQSLRVRRAGQIIVDYIKDLIIASAKEQIAANGVFKIPGDADGDYVFNDSIVEKYEVMDQSNLKDEWDAHASFDVGYVGGLKDTLERYGCSRISLCAFFHAELGLDFLEISNERDVEDAFIRIDICHYGGALADDVERLAEHLMLNRNKYLLFHAIKHG